ncbi:MAG TPA: aspartate carbamoyltransferase catalytic subunit [Dissulfurispiraceae bacterium]|nr:aspartate carbamoyltransferase catalytic subunit [Dissulfurispiraceae bacterium]
MPKDLVSMKDISKEETEAIIDTALSFKDVLRRDIKKVPALRGKTVVNLFFEPSTRTKTSFELAEKRLSTDVINFSVSSSSVVKGESLLDTVRTIESYGIDYLVIRHPSSGVPHFISRITKASVVNAGDGINEHPTQALLDAVTMKEKKGGIAGLEVAIVGDIMHSRVARSNVYCLTKLGASVRLVGPPTLIPRDPPAGVKVFYNMDEGIRGADVVMMLRIQLERMGKSFFPSTKEFFKYWGLSSERFGLADKEALVMHPGPMNRGIEIASDVADSPRSVILDQVTNGIAVRMAVIYMLQG